MLAVPIEERDRTRNEVRLNLSGRAKMLKHNPLDDKHLFRSFSSLFLPCIWPCGCGHVVGSLDRPSAYR